MITLSQELRDHVSQAVTTLAFCWTVRRNDGVVFGFTDHDRPLIIGGVVHDPQTGLNASVAEAELGMAVSTMDVEGALSSDKVSAEDLRRGKFDGAIVETWLVNWENPQNYVLLRKAKIGRIEISGNAFRAELQSLTEAFDKRRGRLVRRHCDAELGDARCSKAINSAAYRGTGIVTASQTQGDFLASGLAGFSAPWFEGGTLFWSSGANAGETAHISLHERDGNLARFALWLAPSGIVSTGDAFQVTAGCDKAFATCNKKFDNALNFQGFPHLPGNDAVYSYVSGEGIFDGAPLVL